MPTTFDNIENNASTTLRADHVASDGTLKLQSGAGLKFGTTFPAEVTAVHGTTSDVIIFRISGKSTDDLTVSAIIGGTNGTTDINLPSGSTVEMRLTKEILSEIEAAIHTLEAGGSGPGTPAGSDGQVQVKSGSGFAAIPGTTTSGGIALGSGCSADQPGNLAFGNGCTVSGAEGSGCLAGGFECEVVDGTGQSGVDWAFAHGIQNRSQSCASFAIGSNALGYARNQLVVGGGTFNYFDDGGGGAIGAGECQAIFQTLIARSDDASPAAFTSAGGGAGGNTVADPILVANHAYAFDVTVIGRKTDGNKFARFKRSGIVRNNGGSAAIVDVVQTIGADIAPAGWSISVGVGTAPHGQPMLRIRTTGEPTVRWAASLQMVEVG